jgi:hypothetical protein
MVDLFDAAIFGTIAGTGDPGVGFMADGQSSVRLSRAVIEGAHGDGVVSTGSTSLTIADLVIRDIVSDLGHGSGIGVIRDRGRLSLTRLWVANTREEGVIAGRREPLDLEDVVVTNTIGRELDGDGGAGISLVRGASAALSRVFVDRSRNAGVALGEASTATIRDITIRSTLGRPLDSTSQGGLDVDRGSTLSLSRAAILSSRGRGFLVTAGSRATANDLAVTGCSPDSTGEDGQGMRVERGSHLSAARVAITGCAESGFDVSDQGSLASVTDLSIRQISALESAASTGMGIRLYGGARLGARCVLVDSVQEYGMWIQDPGTQVVIEDLTIRTVLPPIVNTSLNGRGIGLKEGASLIATRVLVDSTSGAGLMTFDLSGRQISTASISDAVFGHASAHPCTGSACPEPSDAIGIHASPASNLGLARFTILAAARAGVLIESGGTVTLRDGTIESCPIGLLLPIGRDLASVADHVLFEGDPLAADLPAPPSIEPP